MRLGNILEKKTYINKTIADSGAAGVAGGGASAGSPRSQHLLFQTARGQDSFNNANAKHVPNIEDLLKKINEGRDKKFTAAEITTMAIKAESYGYDELTDDEKELYNYAIKQGILFGKNWPFPLTALSSLFIKIHAGATLEKLEDKDKQTAQSVLSKIAEKIRNDDFDSLTTAEFDFFGLALNVKSQWIGEAFHTIKNFDQCKAQFIGASQKKWALDDIFNEHGALHKPKELIDRLFHFPFGDIPKQEAIERSLFLKVLVKAAHQPRMTDQYNNQKHILDTTFNNMRTRTIHENIFDAIFKPDDNSDEFTHASHQSKIIHQLKNIQIQPFQDPRQSFEKERKKYLETRYEEIVPAHNRPATSVTVSATKSTPPITPEMVLKTLWGNIDANDPANDSVCGTTLAKWNEKTISPAIFSPNKFKFKKPELDDIKVEDQNVEITLTAIHQSKNEIDLTLSRHVNDAENQEKWTCQSTDNLIDEKKQFQLIAAESLALRKKLGIKNAEEIEIMDIGDPNLKQASDKLSAREEMLIQAHFDAGYTKITYRDSILTPTSNSLAPPPPR